MVIRARRGFLPIIMMTIVTRTWKKMEIQVGKRKRRRMEVTEIIVRGRGAFRGSARAMSHAKSCQPTSEYLILFLTNKFIDDTAREINA